MSRLRNPVHRQWLLARARRPIFFGTLRRTTPLSDHYGRDRGTPVDRFYIERFLERERGAITGHVLEVLDRSYTTRFGRDVTHSDVLDVDPTNTDATIVADLQTADTIDDDSFDCVILTQTLQYVYDLTAAVAHVHRMLRAGGTVLCTVPTLSRLDRAAGADEYWRLTPSACRRLFEDRFVGGSVAVQAHGNVLTGVAFLTGVAAEELTRGELERYDPFFPLLVTVRATKAADLAAGGPAGRTAPAD